MADKRIKGVVSGPTIESTVAAPLDKRALVPSLDALVSEEWWNGAILYNGLTVTVVDFDGDGTSSIYVLKDKDNYTDIESWQQASGSSFIRYTSKVAFIRDLNSGNVKDGAIAIIEDSSLMWVGGVYYQFFTGYDADKMSEVLSAGNIKISYWMNEGVPSPVEDNWDIENGDTVQSALKKLEVREEYTTKLIESKLFIPDEDDLTSYVSLSGNIIRFNSILANAANFHTYGHIIVRKNLTDLASKNVLSQSLISQLNTIYEIKYDFTLDGKTINLPQGSSLFFNGGKLSNGTIVGGGNSYVFGFVNGYDVKNSSVENAGYYTSVAFKNVYNLDGTLFTSKHFGSYLDRPDSEMAGFTFYDTTLGKLIIWDGNQEDWVDVYGNSITADNYGNNPEGVTEKTTTGFMYHDKSEFWKTLAGEHNSRWIVRNEDGDWDVLANTDIATITLDGLMSAEDKIWLEGEDGHPENGAKTRLSNLENEITALREDFVVSNSFISNSTFTDLLNHWETSNIYQEEITGTLSSNVINSASDIAGWVIPEDLFTDYEQYLVDGKYSQSLSSKDCNTIANVNHRLNPNSNISIGDSVGSITNNYETTQYFYEIQEQEVEVSGSLSGLIVHTLVLLKDGTNEGGCPEKYDNIVIDNSLIKNLSGYLNDPEYNQSLSDELEIFGDYSYSKSGYIYNYQEYEIETHGSGDNIIEVKVPVGPIQHLAKVYLVSSISHGIKFNVTRGGKRFFTFGLKLFNPFGKAYGRFIQCDKASLTSILSDHHGATYAITKDARTSVCIDNNFIRLKYAEFVSPPTMSLTTAGTYIPVSCDLSFYYYVERAGTLYIFFEDESKGSEGMSIQLYSPMNIVLELPVSEGWTKFTTTYQWNSSGNFIIRFTGKIYIHTISTLKDEALQLRSDYEDLNDYVKGATSRFDGFDDSFSDETLIRDTSASGVTANKIIYLSNLKRFVGVITEASADTGEQVEVYCNTWNSVDMYNTITISDEGRTDILIKDKIFIFQDKIYFYDPTTDGLKKYSSDNNDHMINVDKQGFYIVDQNGNIGLQFNETGLSYINQASGTITTSTDIYKDLLDKYDQLFAYCTNTISYTDSGVSKSYNDANILDIIKNGL